MKFEEANANGSALNRKKSSGQNGGTSHGRNKSQ